MSNTVRSIELKGRSVTLVGTAHISLESVGEVSELIEREKPGRVCVEIDANRYQSMTQGSHWESLDLGKVLREGKGFFLLANLTLSGFQKRMGEGIGAKPGEEMLAAVRAAEAGGIPWSFCDRDIQVTLKRAWARSNFWNKTKLLSSLVGSAFSNEKLTEEEIEKLKEQNELEQMMAELADYLPSVKEVLIDERDRYLASKIFEAKEEKIVAVVGAGHMEGIDRWLGKLDRGEISPNVADIDNVPPTSRWTKAAAWLIPVLIVALIALGFLRSGSQASLALILRWILLNGSLAAIGSALCLAHPLTILVSFLMAPVATLNPFVGIGLFAGIAEAYLRKPRVQDFERLTEDIASIKGFYRNRVTHILLIFFLSSIGGMIGNFIALPLLASGAIG
ncbi:MAG: TraB/GumN family protein [Spirochaetes bacterium]|nr:TraB/GumN family protein [Spirochaetota bacterium]